MRTLLIMVVACGTGMWGALDPPNSSAQEAVRSGAEALRDTGRYPWYDADADELRQVEFPTDSSARSSNRDSNWVASEGRSSPRSSPNLSAPSASALNSVVMVLFWVMVVIFFLVLVTALIWALMRQRTTDDDDSLEDLIEDDRTDEERIEQLPFEVKTPRGDLLAEAQRCLQAGDRRQAIILLFSYMLVKLDREQWIRLSKGKTNRQYLGELRDHKMLGGLLERVMVAFEDVFFGKHELSDAEFNECWNQVDQFHQLIETQRG